MPFTPSTTSSPPPRRSVFISPTPTPTRGDGPSPTKRRKLVSPALESTASCASAINTHLQLDAERRAASLRVLNVWSTLEGKYTRRLDEDDIVDLRTGHIVRDRGVLGSSRRWDFGCFADTGKGSSPDVGRDSRDSSPDPEDGDESGDELATWGAVSELGTPFHPVRIPPAQELNPEDAEDLKEFLAAEAARKAEHEEDMSLEGSADADSGDNIDVHVLDTEDSVVEVEAGSVLALSEEESPDELDGYDDTVGEGAMLWEVYCDTAEKVVDHERESSSEVPPSPLSLRCLPSPAQLHTPPQSRSSAAPTPVWDGKQSISLPPLKGQNQKPSQEGESREIPSLLKSYRPIRSPNERDGNVKFPREISFITPKKLVPEVVISPQARDSTAQKARQVEKTPRIRVRASSTSRATNKPPSVGSLAKRRASTSSPLKHPNCARYPSGPPTPALPQSVAKRKRVESEDMEEPYREPRDSTVSWDTEDPPTYLSHQTPSRIPSVVPCSWPSFVNYSPIPWTPNYTREAGPIPTPLPHLDVQVLLAQTIHALNSLAHPQCYIHPTQTLSPSVGHSSRASSPMFPSQQLCAHPVSLSHPPWLTSEHPHSYSPLRHPHSLAQSTSSALQVPEPPSSPESSPLSQKGKGKHVSFRSERRRKEK